MENFKKCKSYTEMGKWLGYTYYNGRVKKEIEKFCLLNNLDPKQIIEDNNKCNKCLHCGKELTGKERFRKKFCNSSCAASYNNKNRNHSEDTKRKIQISVLKWNRENISTKINKKHKVDKIDKFKKCIVCGSEFKPSLTKKGLISKSNTCSKECHHILVSSNSKQIVSKLISEGRHQGWKSRNIISYPENFWIKVLKNNNIKFKHNFPFGKYFLDFYIEIEERKIDLEIDGKQHQYEDRKQSDLKRDDYVKSQKLEVYRIPWNSINTTAGKLEMKEKINKFLKFINKI